MSDTPKTFDDLLGTITPEAYEGLKRAIEIGRWPGGERLRPGQVELCMQAVIAYEAKNLRPEDRVAYIDAPDCKSKQSRGT